MITTRKMSVIPKGNDIRILIVNEDGGIEGEETIKDYSTFTFTGIMFIKDIEKDEHKFRVLLQSMDDGTIYEMMTPELRKMLLHATIDKGRIKARWGFTKHGKYLGIKFIHSEG